MIDAPQLATDLQRLGVAPGDCLMIHASLRAIGPVSGGAAAIIGAIERAVGERGTLLMVLGAHDPWAHVNRLPEDKRPAELQQAEPFDARTTPADPDVGVLAEVFRTLPGTLVSDHPEGRFAARGRAALELTRDPPWDDYFGPGSALERLCRLDGNVLRLGPEPDSTTLLHYAEFLTDLPEKRRVRRHRRVKAAGGPRIRVIESLDDSDGIADYPAGDYFADILHAYLQQDRHRRGKVGNAESELLPAPDLVAFAVRWMNRHLRPDRA